MKESAVIGHLLLSSMKAKNFQVKLFLWTVKVGLFNTNKEQNCWLEMA